MRAGPTTRRRTRAGRAFAVLALAAAILLWSGSCTRHAEPRWLIRALPGSYPGVVYFVPTGLCAVALTIDDGPDPETTPAILQILADHGATATFFLLSDSVVGQEDLIRRMLKQGHELGHHMTSDQVTVGLSDDDLTRQFEKAAGVLESFGPIEWFRAGSGRYDDRVLALTRAHGYRIAMASVFPIDTLVTDPESVAGFASVMVQRGSIIVLHDRGERGRRTAQTLAVMLPRLAERGYRVMSMSALEDAARAEPDGRETCN